MSSYTIEDEVKPLLAGLSDEFESGRGLMTALTTRLHDDLKDHFIERNREPNARGWPKQNFWSQIADATFPGEITQDTGEVVIADYRMRMRVEGGTIKPREAKALTIPLRPEASGRRASTLERDLGVKLFVPGSKDNPKGVLAAMIDGRLQVFYALVKSVEHPADPNALPSDDTILSNLAEEAETYLEGFEN